MCIYYVLAFFDLGEIFGTNWGSWIVGRSLEQVDVTADVILRKLRTV